MEYTLIPDLTLYVNKLKTRKTAGQAEIYDPVRRKWLILQPEEFIRQLFICLLREYFPITRIAIEKKAFPSDQKRYDVLVYDKHLAPFFLIELKEAGQNIKHDALIQAKNYQHHIKAKYLMISNGNQSILIHYPHIDGFGEILRTWPFEKMINQ